MGLGFSIDTSPKIVITQDGKEAKDASEHELVELVESLDCEGFIGTITISAPAKLIGKKPDTPGWSYGGFGRFREKLADEFAINLRLMEGFRPFGLPEMIKKFQHIPGFDPQNADLWRQENAVLWNDIEYHPIHELLNRSDCEGDLSASQCGIIAKHLRSGVKDWSDEDYDKKQAVSLADCMEYCAANSVRLIFC